MKRIAISLITILLIGLNGFAQLVQKFEFEGSVGVTYPITKFHKGIKKGGGDLCLELRYNIPRSPFDCGALINLTSAVYKFPASQDSYWTYKQTNQSVAYMVVGDYNFGQGNMINPFVGAGIGVAGGNAMDDEVYNVDSNSIIFRPRAGIEFVRHIRIGVFSSITRAGFCNIGFSIGGVIGGGLKRPKITQ